MTDNRILQLAIDKLGSEFKNLDLTFHPYKEGKADDVISYFPGGKNEDVMLCVFKGSHIYEPFHRQDFFFINYAYKGKYDALSAYSNNEIAIREDECYISQPYSGYALRVKSDEEVVIIGILIRKEAFFKEYLPAISANARIFHFLLDPQTDRFASEFIHLAFTENHPVRKILEIMVIEYADKSEDTQNIIKPLLLSLFMYISRRYNAENSENRQLTLSEQMLNFINNNVESVSLETLSEKFSYHPNYISAYLHKETGKTFSRLLLEYRMERAITLLKNTTLTIEEIAAMLGYSNHSNFYKAFKSFYGKSPRDFIS